jgi:hypothetical protein
MHATKLHPRALGYRVDTDPSEVEQAASLPLDSSTAELLRQLPLVVAVERVVSEKTAAEFVNLSYGQFRVLRAEGRGPTWLRLDGKRVGYRIRDLMAWCELRKRVGLNTAPGAGEAA